MKPAMIQDDEDDLAAEEENKIINEVSVSHICRGREKHHCRLGVLGIGIQNMVRGPSTLEPISYSPSRQMARVGRKTRHTSTTSS